MRRPVLIAFLALSSVCSAQDSVALLLFGGDDQDIFLGCLNCSATSSTSVCNEYGKYGSPYNALSIWNSYGKYGSRYSATSPWNPYGSKPPVVVDKDGNFYGYLTANAYRARRTTIGGLVALADASEKFDDLDELAKAFCERK